MSRNTGNLSHHEELRLDYLLKNIYYLNENEQNELHYLEQRYQGPSWTITQGQQTQAYLF